MRDYFYSLILMVHVFAGTLSLLSGLIIMICKKGDKLHRISGKVFYYSMVLIAFTAMVISLIKRNDFLLMLAIFAFYQAAAGFRAQQNKSLHPSIRDYLIFASGGINAVCMFLYGQWILMVFAFISLFLLFGQLKTYIAIWNANEIPEHQWLRQHIGMMSGAFIASITAFLVNIQPLGPFPFTWIIPSLIIVPLIIYWTRKYVKSGKAV